MVGDPSGIIRYRALDEALTIRMLDSNASIGARVKQSWA